MAHEDASAVAPGALVSHYTIVHELGRGAMARVYRATDLRSGRDVALKVPRAEGELGPDTIRRFLREVRVAARLVHPHIVALHGGFEHAGLPWLAMEFVEGPTFGERIDASGPLPLADVLRHGEALASALGFAHARGILHHDVSPSNIVIAADGRAKLLDFGLASFLSAPSGGHLGAPGRILERGRGSVVGTAGYMSPEKILGHQLDPRSDLFSLGAVLYEMSTGRPAFRGATREEILDATLETDPPAIDPSDSGHLGVFDEIVRRALAKSPEERYRNAEALETDLRVLRLQTESETRASPS
jgi:serine/threonine protein kinase